MKTAMMQLREKLENAIKVTELEIDPMSIGIRSGFKSIINDIDTKMIEVERDQIHEAFDYGSTTEITSTEYYTETFTGND